jgi:hypothetical protein
MLRVLPRDAFNDANLLKCIGMLTMLIEDGAIDWLQYEYDGQAFDIRQDGASGATFVNNITFSIKDGDYIQHERPLNSRGNWPLVLFIDGEEQEAFDEKGAFIVRKPRGL